MVTMAPETAVAGMQAMQPSKPCALSLEQINDIARRTATVVAANVKRPGTTVETASFAL